MEVVRRTASTVSEDTYAARDSEMAYGELPVECEVLNDELRSQPRAGAPARREAYEQGSLNLMLMNLSRLNSTENLLRTLYAESRAKSKEKRERNREQALPRPTALSCVEPCSFLEPGMQFQGTQVVTTSAHVKCEAWKLHVTVQESDFSRGYVSGTMRAEGLYSNTTHPLGDGDASVLTFWEGEVVDNIHHAFYAKKWGATRVTDMDHWLKFTQFQSMKEILGGMGHAGSQALDMSQVPYIFMRWKERYFVDDAPASCTNLTIAGFYYVCLNRLTGEILGYYFDPNSSPYQKMELKAVSGGSQGMSSAAFEMM